MIDSSAFLISLYFPALVEKCRQCPFLCFVTMDEEYQSDQNFGGKMNERREERGEYLRDIWAQVNVKLELPF